MALQTSHSAEPSSTTSGSSSSSETGSSNSGPPNSPFSAAGSPPLILAFLAIGLFSAAMVIVFGWRRIQYARGLIPQGLTFDEEGMSPKASLVRPKLWDLWNEEEITWAQVSGKEKARRDSELQWANIMPLSANAVPSSPVHESMASIVSSTELPTLARRRDLLDRQPPALRMWRRLRQRQKTREKSTTSSIPSPRLQVEVAILMPSPRYPVYVREEGDNVYHEKKWPKREDMTEFSIGVYQSTWD
ncbi:hypothetical protein CVT26_006020 [Gymnopilus dilepis]|uniref:Uncharacterized protein n=1 Tax=Gymnopilus dilepis TaxID=231916 RepID=A0A409Y1K9_9AGAR|nr:hypothetical protein CVT26_006020 [Gymnopilus dilepis]